MAVKEYTRSGGAKSGVESYFIGPALVLALWPALGVQCLLALIVVLLTAQLACMAPIDRNMLWHAVMSQKLGPSVMRNASIGFAECVRPGGKPTADHCLSLYNYSSLVTSIMFAIPTVWLLAFGPAIALVRIFYPEHAEGVPKNRLRLFWFFVRHPVAVQGEGPSNGDGLAAMNACESILYPITMESLQCGPKDRPYWHVSGAKPRLRDMFHDKMFCHRFFESHGAPHPVLVAEVADHKRREVFLEPDEAPQELLWKPRYSTMGLGVEKFTGWEKMDDGVEWAPSSVPYVIEELIRSTEHEASEWYRMTTLWAYDEAVPKPGYCWRTRNKKGDDRVQTDILGGCYCVTSAYAPYVGPDGKGTVSDPRTGKTWPLDAKVERALTRAIGLQLKMHKNLGKELHSVGWDIMVVEDEPIFIEFNINNGFFAADHSMDELETMADFYSRQFFARLPGQLLHFDPYAANNSETVPLRGWDTLMGGDLKDDGWEQSFISNTFQFGRPIPNLETTLRTWMLARLQDPKDKLRLQICRGYDPPCYTYSDEPAEVLCDRILVRQDCLQAGKKRTVPEKDGARFFWNPTGFSFFVSHIFFDGANAWKILGELFDNSKHIPCPEVKYTSVASEVHLFLGAMLSLWCGQPQRSLECGPDSMLSSSSFDINIDPVLGLKRANGGPFVASIVGVLGCKIFQHLQDTGKKVPNELHVGVLVGFSVEQTSHFNDYGVVPLRIRRPKTADGVGEICREAGAQLRARAVIAESSWLLPNVYDRRKIGFIDVYSCLDFVVSCAPMTGGKHTAPLNFIGTEEPLKLMSTYIYITMPLYCIAQSYDSKVDLTFVSRAADVSVPQLQDSIQGWASQGSIQG